MTRYAIAGASSRCHEMFAKPIAEKFVDAAQIVGIFDINRTRAEFLRDDAVPDAPVFTDFGLMLRETRPDTVIVATIDSFHHEYIIKALEYGCDVITEKPMTIDEVKCKAILEAEQRSGRKVTVTFNYRFAPYVTRIKELLKENIVGRILSVDFEYLLDRSHGADYFRRWHRRKENSGGLLVHKSTHHFDFINWWLEEDPEEVYANGTRRFYGPTRENRGERCSACRYADSCEFAVRYQDDEFMNNLYFKAEGEDGYIRDGCVFSEDIDIEDSMSVTVRYTKGALLTYSLIAYSPYEGWRASINGTEGRIEACEYHSGHKAGEPANHIQVYDKNGELVTYTIRKSEGVHWGADDRLQRMLFRGDLPDPLGHFADSCAGAKSIMVGVCANKSMAEKKPFFVNELLK